MGDPELTAVRRPFEAAFLRMCQAGDLDRSTALIHRCRPSAPRTRPNHCCRSLRKQRPDVTMVAVYGRDLQRHPRTSRDRWSILLYFGSDTRGSRRKLGGQMAERGPDYIRKAKSDEKVLVLKENGNVVFTKPYTKHTLLSKKEYAQGTTGIVTRLHTGLLGEIRRVDIRLADGNFLRDVLVDYFRA
jgi:hypothetical protein